MSDQVEGSTTDAAAVGLALIFAEGLRGQLAAMAERWAPVDRAVEASSAGLVELGLVTAGLNGSVAVARPIGAGRVRRRADDATVSGSAHLAGRPLVESGANGLGTGEVMRRAERIIKNEGGSAPGVPVVEMLDGDSDGLGESLFKRKNGPDSKAFGGIVASTAPVGASMGSGRAGVAGVARGSQELGGREAIAPVIAPAMVTVEWGNSESAGFGSSGGPVGAGAMAQGVAPVAGVLTGLRADVGAALGERAASRGPAQPLRDDVGSAAFARSGGRGSRGTMMGGGLDELPTETGSAAAWAPQPAGRGAGGSGGDGRGIVQLDGRLVGQWLSEGMAREAARPGAGTTFFDPRQAPAWTPSGSI